MAPNTTDPPLAVPRPDADDSVLQRALFFTSENWKSCMLAGLFTFIPSGILLWFVPYFVNSSGREGGVSIILAIAMLMPFQLFLLAAWFARCRNPEARKSSQLFFTIRAFALALIAGFATGIGLISFCLPTIFIVTCFYTLTAVLGRTNCNISTAILTSFEAARHQRMRPTGVAIVAFLTGGISYLFLLFIRPSWDPAQVQGAGAMEVAFLIFSILAQLRLSFGAATMVFMDESTRPSDAAPAS